MNKLFFLATAVCSMIMSCSNPDKSERTNDQSAVANDSGKNVKKDMITQKITPCLWVETTDAKAVADYYLSIF